MEEQREGFRPAAKNKIDIKKLDEQLQRHLEKVLIIEEKKKKKEKEQVYEREIDPKKLVLKEAFAHGTFASVHRGLYDGQQVAVEVLELGEEGERRRAERDFQREVSVWYKLDHPNITKCIGATTKIGILPSSNSACVITDKPLEFSISQERSMEEQREGFRPAAKNKIDIKSLDNQLQKHLEKVRIIEEKKTKKEQETVYEWEIDPEKLVLKEAFAHGTFASVHRGLYDGQQVAVKVLELPSSNSACVITEYLCGGTVKSYLIKHRKRKLPFETVLQLALDVARGLSYLHSENIVHRDVKTENLILDKHGKVKIADFGVARFQAWDLSEMTGNTGTPGYMAPEVLESKPYDKKCDIYSFGICLWEIFCCRMPYSNYAFSELISDVVYKNLRPEIPKGCPRSLAKVMRRCWDAEPSKRPEMEEVITMLEGIDVSKNPQGCFCFCMPNTK